MMPDFWPDEWVRTLREIEATDFDFVISAHGPHTQPAIDPANVVMEQRVYLEDLMAAVKKAMEEGARSPDALQKNPSGFQNTRIGATTKNGCL